MVLILEGNSEQENIYFWRKTIRFVTALDLISCLKQIKKKIAPNNSNYL